MADYGLKISKSGADADTATDKTLAYSTKFHSLKIYKTGTLQLQTDGSGDDTESAAHGLGFAPAFKVFGDKLGNYYPDPGNVSYLLGNDFFKLHAYTDTSNIYWQADGATASSTFTCRYAVFGDLAQTFSSSSVSQTEDYGLKISKPGKDVTTAEVYDLAFTSSMKQLKLDPNKIGSTTLSLGAIDCDDSPNTQTTSTSIAHGYGYAPFYLCWFKSNNSSIYWDANTDKMTMPGARISGTTDETIYSLESYCNSTNVVFHWYRKANCFTFMTPCDLECINWGAETVTIYYYIFKEDISDWS